MLIRALMDAVLRDPLNRVFPLDVSNESEPRKFSDMEINVTEQLMLLRSYARAAVFGGVVVISTVTVAAICLFLGGVTLETAIVPDMPPADFATEVRFTVPGVLTSITSL